MGRLWQMFGVLMVVAIFILIGLIAFKMITGDYKCPIMWENNTVEQVSCFDLDCEGLGCIECKYYRGLTRCDCTLDAPTMDGSCWE